ncbi:MAG TPA: S1 RNA-binding domain-containing protein [Abditibacterium sp.]
MEDTQTNNPTATDNQSAAPSTDNGSAQAEATPTSDATAVSPEQAAIAESYVVETPTEAPVAEAAPVAEVPAPVAEAPVAPAAPSDGRPPKQPSMAQVMELDEFAAFMAGADSLTRGALMKGIVVRREDNGSVLVDVGGKSEGIIPRNELGEEDVNIGDEVEVVVVRPEDDEGHPILSKRRADFERLKREIAEAKETGAILQATVRESVKGGLLVDLGVSAFVPASHVDIRNRSDLARLVGRIIPVRVIEVDFKKNRDKVIASHRLAAEEEREKRESEAWTTLEKDKIVEGIVRRITDFGAFVDIGGIDGLLHVREMAWGRVEHPSQVVKKGQKLQVLILELDEERKRVALGLKQLLPDPWKKAAKNFRVGQTVKGKVVRLAEACAFVELEPGVEAIVPISELSEERIKTPDEAVQVGQEVEGRIKSIQSNVRRITMSLRAAVVEKERQETRSAVREVNTRANDDGPLRLGDLFGNELRAARDRGKERNRSREEARALKAEESDEDEDLDFLDDDIADDDVMDEVEEDIDVSAYSAAALKDEPNDSPDTASANAGNESVE